MPIKLSFGGTDVASLLKGDLAAFLKQPDADKLIAFDAKTLGALSRPVSDIPAPFTGTFEFDTSPSWSIPQHVSINLSVKAGVTCTIAVLKPGDTMFTYSSGPDAASLKDTAVTVDDGRYYITIELDCSISLSAGASWSSGPWGVSGNISNQDTFSIKSGYWVPGTTTLKDSLVSAFSNFVLPFQATSIAALPDGDFIDFDFIGNLQLGFGATYGFSGLFFAGMTPADLTASLSTPIGKTVMSAEPSYSVGASFKATYTHADKFRIIAVRVSNASFDGVKLYLFRQDRTGLQTVESFGITVSAGAKFQTDATTLQSEIQKVSLAAFGNTAGALLGGKIASAAASAVNDINNSVTQLLSKADGVSVLKLEAEQSVTHENTALFAFTFDFQKSGQQGYGLAMAGNYAAAVQQPGAQVSTDSFVEQLYIRHAGLSLQLFHVLNFSDMTNFIQQSQVYYVDGGRTLQVVDLIGFKSVSGLVGKDREADLFFKLTAKMPVAGAGISGLGIDLSTSFIDKDNAAAFAETVRALSALGLDSVAGAVQKYIAANPHGSISITIDADAQAFANLPVTPYPNGRPPSEPHSDDARNYAGFVQQIKVVIGQPDQYAGLFETAFGTYDDWLAFNRVKNDSATSQKPGDRLREGNTVNAGLWPDEYPPTDETGRKFVQVYLLAAQQFMNFCASVRDLAATTDTTLSAENFNQLLRSISGMIRKEVPFPTYFLKSGIVALMTLANVRLAVAGDVPDPMAGGTFSINLQASRTAAAARM